MIGLAMKLGLAAPLAFMVPHGTTSSPPVPAPMVRAVPATGPPLSATVPEPRVTPKAPVPVDPILGAAPATPPVAAAAPSVCTVRWSALPATDPVTGQTGAYPATFVGSCAEAYAYAQVGGGVVTPGMP
jgi:hypothetical protein